MSPHLLRCRNTPGVRGLGPRRGIKHKQEV